MADASVDFLALGRSRALRAVGSYRLDRLPGGTLTDSRATPTALCHRTTGWTAAEASQPPRRATLSGTGGATTRRVPLFYRRPLLRAWRIARRGRRRDRPNPLSQWTARRDRPLLRRGLLRWERRPRRRCSVQTQRRVPLPHPTWASESVHKLQQAPSLALIVCVPQHSHGLIHDGWFRLCATAQGPEGVGFQYLRSIIDQCSTVKDTLSNVSLDIISQCINVSLSRDRRTKVSSCAILSYGINAPNYSGVPHVSSEDP